MNAIIDEYGLRIPYEEFKNTFTNMTNVILKKFILEYTPTMGVKKTCQLYTIINIAGTKYITIPRMSIKIFIENKFINSVKVKLTHNEAKMSRKVGFELLDYQQIIFNHLTEKIYNKPRSDCGLSSCVLNLQAGAGKTFVAAALIAHLGVKTLFITTLKHLAHQAHNDMKNVIDANIIVSKKYSSADVTIMVINSALKLPISDIKKYSFVIFDEIHTMCSNQRAKIFNKMQSKYILGLSATTDHRNDGFDSIYKKHLGDVIYAAKLPGFNFKNIEFKLNIKFIKYFGSYTYTKNLKHASTGVTFVHYMYNQFMRDKIRLEVICCEIDRLLEDPRRNIYVFAEEVANLQEIIKFYTARRNSNNINDADIALYDNNLIGYFVGGVSVAETQNIKDNARLVFTTYKMSSTGTSWVKMNAMILATPRKSGIEQLAARILRQGSDIDYPREIVDIVDMRTCLRRQMKNRKKSYKIYNPTLEKVIIRKQKIGYEIGTPVETQMEIIE